jgi:hypothetical protein
VDTYRIGLAVPNVRLGIHSVKVRLRHPPLDPSGESWDLARIGSVLVHDRR